MKLAGFTSAGYVNVMGIRYRIWQKDGTIGVFVLIDTAREADTINILTKEIVK